MLSVRISAAPLCALGALGALAAGCATPRPPGVLEEGLCDLVAHTIVPGAAAIERAEYAVLLASAIDGSLCFEAPRLIGHGVNATLGGDPKSYVVRATIEREDLPSFDEALR